MFKLLAVLFLAAFMVYAEEVAVEEVEIEVAETVAETAPVANVNSNQAIIDRLPFKGGVFACPMMEEINQLFPSKAVVVIPPVVGRFMFNKRLEGAWNLYRGIYLEAEKAVMEGTSENVAKDVFLMLSAYDELLNISLFFYSKREKKLEAARDESVDHLVFLEILRELGYGRFVDEALLKGRNPWILPLDDQKARVKAGKRERDIKGPIIAEILVSRKAMERVWNRFIEEHGRS